MAIKVAIQMVEIINGNTTYSGQIIEIIASNTGCSGQTLEVIVSNAHGFD